MDEKFLKSKEYYNNLYDKFTVEECRRMEKNISEVDFAKYKDKELLKDEEVGFRKYLNDVSLYFIKGERYSKKAEKIIKWMDKDKERDEKLVNAVEPENVRCVCGSRMELTMRNLMTGLDVDRVLFLFRCPNCRKGRGIYDDGEEHVSSNEKCKKCGGKNEVTDTRKGDIITMRMKCLVCGNEGNDTLDIGIKKTEELVDENFEKDKERFCISDKEGYEYLDYRRNMDELGKIIEKEKEKESQKEVYDQLKNLKRLTIVDLENTLAKQLEKNEYIKLELLNPEIGKDMIVPFTARDAKSDRVEYDSKHGLRKLIDKILFDTNWRLMSEGIYYRMGFLSGKLKAIENEDDLVLLIKTGKKGANLIKENK
ncbi:MAG: hypothetical protein US63_C0008G0010 [Candidatus Moranbacteria bacterium GW2011_GWC2_37_8]|nr:MAG: hypothetical protein US63_C0008G0010 [Candidatus Moranbacteria bacterium GW2011_GWC2_37_8]KKQ62391.1 MAG: hypothetical protein US82_C0012G0009 [Parcubacteria group bacterium GW2011_GWC1_38_22]KKQ79511.1 MAG: hypothetical protein UT03_C0051G0003 [Candidatus Moranbacteria bacterium GW2011_GWD2_38_7]